MKTRITLWLPGIICPYLSAIKDKSTLARWLSRADKHPAANNLEQTFKFYFKGFNGALPSGALGALSHGLIEKNNDQTWCRVCPIECLVTHQAAIIQKSLDLRLNFVELATLSKALSGLLQLDNMDLQVVNETQWYVKVSHNINVVMNDMLDALHKNMIHYLPSGPDQAYWLRLITECQMLLQTCEFNQSRSSLNLPLISVWFSGIGKLPQNVQTGFDLIYTNESEVKGLGLCADRQVQAQAAQYSATFLENCQEKEVLIADFNIYRYLKHQDEDAWLELVKQYEINFFEPLMKAVRNGQINHLTLNFGDGYLYRVTKNNLKYFWRKIRLLTYFAVK